MTAHFDPLEYVQQLETAGVPKAQAEVHARTLGHVIDDCVAVAADLVSLKRDLTHLILEVETRLRAEISGVETQLRAEISEVETRLRAEISGVETRLRAEIFEVATRLRAEIAKAESGLRAEIQELEARVNSKLEIMEARLNSRIDELKAELRFHRWVSGVTLAFVVAIFAQSLRLG